MMRIAIIALHILFFDFAYAQAPARDLTDATLDMKPSWNRADVYVPGRLLNTNVMELAKLGPIDAVLYLHGCAGVQEDENQWAKMLNDMGFVVVMPESTVIGNSHECGHTTSAARTIRGKTLREVMIQRVTEAVYAIDRLKSLPNVRRIFVMGFSMGGITAFTAFREYKDQEGVTVSAFAPKIAGVISVSSFCASPIAVPNDAPLLLLNFETDPYYPVRPNQCAEKTSNRRGVTNIILKGHGHEAAMDRIARESVKDFLGTHISK